MRNRLHERLLTSDEAASPGDLLDIVFGGAGDDSEFGREFLRVLLAEDPRFREDSEGAWRPVRDHVLSGPIADTPFVIVDLETTGHHPDQESVTEIGAVRVQGGKVVARFEQFVNPSRPIPAFVTKLTGITDAMVADAPPIHEVIGRFAEFAAGGVLVAHNAAFDAGLLDRESRRTLGRPLGLPTLCTVKLAQRLLPELRRTSLDALCEHFSLDPNARHRALGDAETTAIVLERLTAVLLERGARTAEDILDAQVDPNSPRELKVHVPQSDLESLPNGPGVYRLIGEEEDSLYIARAANVRDKVLAYFLSADHLSDRQLTMISKTYEISVTPCGSELEAAIIEADEVRRFEPPYNRSGKHMPKVHFAKLSLRGDFPRSFVTSRLRTDRALYVGPLRGRTFAQDAADLIAAAFRLRTCPGNLRPSSTFEACELAGKGHCSAPCNESVDADAYREQVEGCKNALFRGPECLRESLAGLGLVSGSADSRRFQAAARRLERAGRDVSWLVNDQHYFAVTPAAAPGQIFIAAVVGGHCVGTTVASSSADIDALITLVNETGDAASEDLGDASTILAQWLSRGDFGVDATPVHYDPNDPASLEKARGQLLARLDP
ncbi:MAG: DNA polymerase-3 subunit epsilon [Hyphomicrobiaceae bacterium]